jgi:hypothetical protein
MKRNNTMMKHHSVAMNILVVLAVIGSLTCPATAIDVLYDFEDQTSPHNVVDIRDNDGSQNGQTNQTSGAGPGGGPSFGLFAGVNGSGGLDFTALTFITSMVETQGVVDFATAMSFSVDIKPNVVAAVDTQVPLMWTGRNRGLGETSLGINEFGQLVFTMAGLNPGGSFTSTDPNVIQLDQYQTVGFTLGLATNELIFYLNGSPIDTFSDVGLAQATLPGNGHAPDSPVQVGWFQNIAVGGQTQYTGFVDNVFISDRFLTAAEMAALPGAVVENCGDPGTQYHPYDLDLDCYVSLGDFALIAAKWMLCNNPQDLACTE